MDGTLPWVTPERQLVDPRMQQPASAGRQAPQMQSRHDAVTRMHLRTRNGPPKSIEGITPSFSQPEPVTKRPAAVKATYGRRKGHDGSSPVEFRRVRSIRALALATATLALGPPEAQARVDVGIDPDAPPSLWRRLPSRQRRP